MKTHTQIYLVKSAAFFKLEKMLASIEKSQGFVIELIADYGRIQQYSIESIDHSGIMMQVDMHDGTYQLYATGFDTKYPIHSKNAESKLDHNIGELHKDIMKVLSNWSNHCERDELIKLMTD